MGETEVLETTTKNEEYAISYYKQGEIISMPVPIALNEVPNDRIISVQMSKSAQTNDQEKNFVRFCTNKIFDDSEVIRSEIADLLGMPVPKVFRLTRKESNTETQGIYIRCALETTDTVVSLDDKFNHINSLVQGGQYNKEDYPEYAIERNEPTNPITDPNVIYQIIAKGVKGLPLGELNDKQAGRKVIAEYTHMILSDLITGQVSRNGNEYYYFTRVEEQSNKIDEAGNSIPMPHRKIAEIIPGVGHYRYASKTIPENVYGLNGFYVDRDELLHVLFEFCYEYIADIVKPLREVSSKYKECIHSIVAANTDEQTASDLERIYTANIDKLCELEQAKTKNGNQVELVSSTTRLNLGAVSRITTFMEKYKIVEQKEEKQQLEGDSRLTLKMEDTKPENNSGYVSAVLVGTIMAFVCGLGVGLAYILINLP